MRIACLTLNHHLIPLETRELFALDHQQSVQFLNEIKSHHLVLEALILSTCNRLELFVVAKDAESSIAAAHGALEDLCERSQVNTAALPINHLVLDQPSAVRHLMRVASGMESQILGESQVLGQVRDCHRLSEEAGTTGKILRKLWERSLRAGKRVRSETAIGEGALSVSYAALQLARKIFGGIAGRKVVVIGTGEIAQHVLQNLQGISLGCLTILNRTQDRAEQLAQNYGGTVRKFEEMEDVLSVADLVIASTSKMEPVITRNLLLGAKKKRARGLPLLIVDLGLPRNVEPTCASLKGVFLKNLDDLAILVGANLRERKSEIPAAETIVEQEALGFLNWLDGLRVEPMIKELRKVFEELCRDELEKIRPELDDRSFEHVEKLADRLIRKLLHHPSKNLRRHEGVRNPEVIALIQDVFTNMGISETDVDASEVSD